MTLVGNLHKLQLLTSQAEDVPRARAAQMLAMLVQYGLVPDAWLEGEGFGIQDDHGVRHLSPEQVLAEYGERIARMVTGVMEGSELTTTEVSVPVGEPGPVPYILDVGDRLEEYPRFWPR